MSNDLVTSRRGIFGRLYHGETSFDFVGKRKIGFAISITLILLTLGSLFTRGLNLGIDFEGGVAWQVPSSETMDVDAARAVLDDNGVPTENAKVQTLTSGTTSSIRIQVGDRHQGQCRYQRSFGEFGEFVLGTGDYRKGHTCLNRFHGSGWHLHRLAL